MDHNREFCDRFAPGSVQDNVGLDSGCAFRRISGQDSDVLRWWVSWCTGFGVRVHIFRSGVNVRASGGADGSPFSQTGRSARSSRILPFVVYSGNRCIKPILVSLGYSCSRNTINTIFKVSVYQNIEKKH